MTRFHRLSRGCISALTLSSLCLSLPAGAGAGEQTFFFDTNGYRIDQFRSPVPNTVRGAKTVGTEDVVQLRKREDNAPILIDVLPRPPKPEGLSATTLWLPPVRYNIPGSVWLPNVGYGRLSDDLEHYFRSNLSRLTNGDTSKPVILYCLDDCWMSWNAARRAAEWGYREVFWYPQGTDGWEFAEHPLEVSVPIPMK